MTNSCSNPNWAQDSCMYDFLTVTGHWPALTNHDSPYLTESDSYTVGQDVNSHFQSTTILGLSGLKFRLVDSLSGPRPIAQSSLVFKI